MATVSRVSKLAVFPWVYLRTGRVREGHCALRPFLWATARRGYLLAGRPVKSAYLRTGRAPPLGCTARVCTRGPWSPAPEPLSGGCSRGEANKEGRFLVHLRGGNELQSWNMAA